MSTPKPRVPIMMRLPDDLHERLRAYAEQTVRSVNSSAEVLLRRALDQAAAAGEYVPPRASTGSDER